MVVTNEKVRSMHNREVRYAGHGRSWKDCPYSKHEVLQVFHGKKQNKTIAAWITKYLNETGFTLQ